MLKLKAKVKRVAPLQAASFAFKPWLLVSKMIESYILALTEI